EAGPVEDGHPARRRVLLHAHLDVVAAGSQDNALVLLRGCGVQVPGAPGVVVTLSEGERTRRSIPSERCSQPGLWYHPSLSSRQGERLLLYDESRRYPNFPSFHGGLTG
ncbi:MAG TPA: hypothetical protein VJK04_00820, partial [Candidatus Paceibacterota bacterium]